MRRALLAAALGAALALARPAAAQIAGPPAICPDSGIATLSTEPSRPGTPRPLGTSVDTAFTISVDRASWIREEWTGGVAAGARGMAPASWRACAGASVSLRRATVTVENARGRVYVRASLEALLEVLRRHEPPRRENPGTGNP